jgi:thiamine pyrophosphokinase
VGDFDSLTPADLDEMRNAGVELAQYPRNKDETDLELALLRAAGAGYTSIRIAAGLGGRLDQTLGNVFLMNLPQLQSLDVRLEDGHEEVFIIRGSCQVQGHPGDVISLLPLFGPAYSVTTQRLRYPLNAETLWPEHTRGISNVMLADTAQISLNSGLLLCIHTREAQS